MCARVAQLVEPGICNSAVAGSSPAPSSKRRHPKVVGDRSEVEVFIALYRAGYGVLTAPFGENLRYDCVIDDGARLLRVQVKTGRVANGAIRFPVCSTYWYGRTRRGYRGEVDLFAVYCPATGRVYLVPIDECGSSEVWLRLVPTRNRQRSRVRWASDYELRPLHPAAGDAPAAPARQDPSPRRVREAVRLWLD